MGRRAGPHHIPFLLVTTVCLGCCSSPSGNDQTPPDSLRTEEKEDGDGFGKAARGKGVVDLYVDSWIPHKFLMPTSPAESAKFYIGTIGYQAFGGDNRGTQKGGNARTRHWVSLELKPGGGFRVLGEVKRIGLTHGYWKTGGKWAKPNVDRAGDSGLSSHVKSDGGHVVVEMKGSAGNPLVAHAPSIDYEYSVRLAVVTNPDTQKREIRAWLSGSHDGYPNYSVWLGTKCLYVHDYGGHKQELESLFPPMEWEVPEPGGAVPSGVVPYPE